MNDCNHCLHARSDGLCAFPGDPFVSGGMCFSRAYTEAERDAQAFCNAVSAAGTRCYQIPSHNGDHRDRSGDRWAQRPAKTRGEP